jgi:hypothetical protein
MYCCSRDSYRCLRGKVWWRLEGLKMSWNEMRRARADAPFESSKACTFRIGPLVSLTTPLLVYILLLIIVFLPRSLLPFLLNLYTLSLAATLPVLPRPIPCSLPAPVFQKSFTGRYVVNSDPSIVTKDNSGLVGCRSVGRSLGRMEGEVLKDRLMGRKASG